jgi:hypothetical protein
MEEARGLQTIDYVFNIPVPIHTLNGRMVQL